LEEVYTAQVDLNSKEQRVAKIDNEVKDLTRVAERYELGFSLCSQSVMSSVLNYVTALFSMDYEYSALRVCVIS
jgi:hypothetical protein